MTYNISIIKNCHTSKMRINHTTGHISEIQLITNQKYNLKYIRRITYNISKIKLVTQKKNISKKIPSKLEVAPHALKMLTGVE